MPLRHLIFSYVQTVITEISTISFRWYLLSIFSRFICHPRFGQLLLIELYYSLKFHFHSIKIEGNQKVESGKKTKIK